MRGGYEKEREEYVMKECTSGGGKMADASSVNGARKP